MKWKRMRENYEHNPYSWVGRIIIVSILYYPKQFANSITKWHFLQNNNKMASSKC